MKPRERSSGGARPAEEDGAAQSAKAPESEGNLLVVATTEGGWVYIWKNKIRNDKNKYKIEIETKEIGKMRGKYIQFGFGV